jgi:hypothetical protein
MQTVANVVSVVSGALAVMGFVLYRVWIWRAAKSIPDRRHKWLAFTELQLLDPNELSGNARQLARNAYKAAILGLAFFMVILSAQAVGDPRLWNVVALGLLICPMVMGLAALFLLRSPNREAGH